MTELRTTEDMLRGALKALLGLTSTIEVLGEWEALDINRSARTKNRAIVDQAISDARAALSLPPTPGRVEYRAAYEYDLDDRARPTGVWRTGWAHLKDPMTAERWHDTASVFAWKRAHYQNVRIETRTIHATPWVEYQPVAKEDE